MVFTAAGQSCPVCVLGSLRPYTRTDGVELTYCGRCGASWREPEVAKDCGENLSDRLEVAHSPTVVADATRS